MLTYPRFVRRAGISRKTGYQWAEKHAENDSDRQKPIENELAQIQAEHAKLKKEFDHPSLENRGHKLAWDIHGVDAYLASKKKNTMSIPKKKKL
jgi:hypothetical protein